MLLLECKDQPPIYEQEEDLDSKIDALLKLAVDYYPAVDELPHLEETINTIYHNHIGVYGAYSAYRLLMDYINGIPNLTKTLTPPHVASYEALQKTMRLIVTDDRLTALKPSLYYGSSREDTDYMREIALFDPEQPLSLVISAHRILTNTCEPDGEHNKQELIKHWYVDPELLSKGYTMKCRIGYQLVRMGYRPMQLVKEVMCDSAGPTKTEITITNGSRFYPLNGEILYRDSKIEENLPELDFLL